MLLWRCFVLLGCFCFGVTVVSQTVAVVGPSGSGTTSLMSVTLGLLQGVTQEGGECDVTLVLFRGEAMVTWGEHQHGAAGWCPVKWLREGGFDCARRSV